VLCDVALANEPVPLEDHVPDVEFVDVAEIGTAPEVEHVVYGPPAFAVGVPWMVSRADDIAALEHGSVGAAVHVSILDPAAMSPALGVYVVLGEDALANVPEPVVVHRPEAEFVDVAMIGTGPLPAHVEYGPPALLVGPGWIVSVALDIAVPEHGAIAFAVHVNVTLPAVLSAPLGVYVVMSDDALPKDPLPLVDHVPDEEFVELAEIDTAPLPLHVE
jgi:hypothetical protein